MTLATFSAAIASVAMDLGGTQATGHVEHLTQHADNSHIFRLHFVSPDHATAAEWRAHLGAEMAPQRRLRRALNASRAFAMLGLGAVYVLGETLADAGDDPATLTIDVRCKPTVFTAS